MTGATAPRNTLSSTSSSLLQRTLLGNYVSDTPPVWMMRQAGRHLPEYLALRASFPSFIDFCLSPQAAAEATLQPVRRYDTDAAIIFSDILIVPYAMGCDVTFIKNSGPAVTVPDEGIAPFNEKRAEKVYEAIRTTRQELTKEKSLIGFCGLPWTLWLYITGIPGEKEFAYARRDAVSFTEEALKALDLLTDAVITHAKRQIDAGADVIQLFESWAGLAPKFLRESFITAPATRVVAELNAYAPDVPVILFAKGLGEGVADYINAVGPQGAGVDPFTDLRYVRDNTTAILQGNFDPHIFFADKATIAREVAAAKELMSGRGYVANLGHGVLPQTSPDKVQYFIDCVRD